MQNENGKGTRAIFKRSLFIDFMTDGQTIENLMMRSAGWEFLDAAAEGDGASE
jgi:hypothetical protein